jgi:hypothetical protein
MSIEFAWLPHSGLNESQPDAELGQLIESLRTKLQFIVDTQGLCYS